MLSEARKKICVAVKKKKKKKKKMMRKHYLCELSSDEAEYAHFNLHFYLLGLQVLFFFS